MEKILLQETSAATQEWQGMLDKENKSIKSGMAFSCSMDDGHPSDMKMAELLRKHNLNGTFFLPIKNCEGIDVMARQQIRDIGRDFEIGSHTYNHCYLNSVDITEARYQITEGKKQLEDLLGKQIVGFCYPGGHYRKEHADIVQSAGFRYARTTTNLCFEPGDNVFALPTTIQFYPHRKAVYLRNFVKGGNWQHRSAGLRMVLTHQDWIERLYALFDWSCRHSGKFHLWGHSWEIDALDSWNELDRFLMYVATKVPLQDRLNNAQLAARSFPCL